MNLDIDTPKFVLEEADTINPLLVNFNRPGRPPVTINREVTRWCWFVGRLEHGEIASLDEYIGYLETRDLLDKILGVIPASAREKLIPFLDEWNKRFEEGTDTTSRPVSAREEDGKRWHRVPKILPPGFQRDLRERKIS